MPLDCKVIQLEDLDEILEFENRKLIEAVPDEWERTFQHWHSRWRKESLQHHLPMGWSFLAREIESGAQTGPLMGYFLAQPLLFFEGQTQSLWVEHLQFQSLQVRDHLCDLAYRLAREKHFQRVYFPNINSIQNAIQQLKPEVWSPQVLQVKTSK